MPQKNQSESILSTTLHMNNVTQPCSVKLKFIFSHLWLIYLSLLSALCDFCYAAYTYLLTLALLIVEICWSYLRGFLLWTHPKWGVVYDRWQTKGHNSTYCRTFTVWEKVNECDCFLCSTLL